MHRKIILFLQGYVKVQVTGFAPERFLNLCNYHGIELWDLIGDAEGFSCCMRAAAFRQLSDLVWKTKVRVRILEKYGLPFLVFQNRKRRGWAVGVLTAFFLLLFCSQRLWSVSFEGNSLYTDALLGKYLREAGYRTGMAMDKIVCEDIEKMLRIAYNDITWVSAEISGTRIIVRVKENEAQTLEVSQEEPCHIQATRDATIVSIMTKSGTPLVKAGDVVQIGDLLVSGTVDILDDSKTVIGTHDVAAKADIIGEYTYIYTDTFSVTYEERFATGRIVEAFEIYADGKSWMLGTIKEGWHCLTEDMLCIGNMGLRKHIFREFASYERRYSDIEAQAVAEERLAKHLTADEGTTSTCQSLALEQNGGQWYVTAVIHAVGPIGEKIVPLYE